MGLCNNTCNQGLTTHNNKPKKEQNSNICSPPFQSDRTRIPKFLWILHSCYYCSCRRSSQTKLDFLHFSSLAPCRLSPAYHGSLAVWNLLQALHVFSLFCQLLHKYSLPQIKPLATNSAYNKANEVIFIVHTVIFARL